MQPIRCCLAKGSRLWVGYWNKVHVVDMESRKVEVRNQRGACFVWCVSCSNTVISPSSQQTFSVSERSEKQVRFLCAGGSGVWASCRLDPILRLFDWSTGRPLQEVDFGALVTKTLGADTVIFCLFVFLPSLMTIINLFVDFLFISHTFVFLIKYYPQAICFGECFFHTYYSQIKIIPKIYKRSVC